MIEIELNQQIKLERTDIFTILNPPIMNTDYFSIYLISPFYFFLSFVVFLIALVHILLDLQLSVGWAKMFVWVFGNVLKETSFLPF